jgi:hypothetical protein
VDRARRLEADDQRQRRRRRDLVQRGRTWTTEQNQPTGQFYHVITDNQFPYRIYGAQQDSTTVSIASRTGGGGTTRRTA